MNTYDSFLAILFVLLGLAAWPTARVRRAVLALLARGGQLVTLVGVALCGLSAFRPELVPEPVRLLLGTAGLTDVSPLTWLLYAGILVAGALPLLAHLDHAREVAFYAAVLRAVGRKLMAAPAAANTPSPAAGSDEARPLSEIDQALEAMRAAAGTVASRGSAPRKLVKDFLDQPR